MSGGSAPAAPTARPPARARGRAILHDRRLLVLLIAGGVMAGVVVIEVGFSGAMFTASSSTPANGIATGQVTLSVTPSPPQAIVPNTSGSYALVPGDSPRGTVTVKNLGSKATVSLRVTGLNEGAAPRLSSVIVVVLRERGTERCRKLLASLDCALGTWASLESHTYEIELLWPGNQTDPGLRGKTASFSFSWHAESVPS
jgi:hypothetical protein